MRALTIAIVASILLLVTPAAAPEPHVMQTERPVFDPTFNFGWMNAGERFTYRATTPDATFDFAITIAASTGGTLETRWSLDGGNAVLTAEFAILGRELIGGSGARSYTWIDTAALQATSTLLGHDAFAPAGLTLEGYVFEAHGSRFVYDAVGGYLVRAQYAGGGLSVVLLAHTSGANVPTPTFVPLDPYAAQGGGGGSNEPVACNLPVTGPLVNPALPSNAGALTKECTDRTVVLNNGPDTNPGYPGLATGTGKYEVRRNPNAPVTLRWGECTSDVPYYTQNEGLLTDLDCPSPVDEGEVHGQAHYLYLDGRGFQLCLFPAGTGFRCVWQTYLADRP